MRIRIASGFFTSRMGIAILALGLVLLFAGASVFAYYYIQFGHLIDQRLTGQIFQNTSRVYSSADRIYVGETMRPSELASYLLRAGYQEGAVAGSPGKFQATGSTVEIVPSLTSYFQGHNSLRVSFSGTEIASITRSSDGSPLDFADIEPELLT
ncbi:MAG TPA: hypothetical protein VEI55_02075, partial [Candidatus Acidoferrum sp.]|nr:hypothetical protein [Candidatus Acidoferrum sp.]